MHRFRSFPLIVLLLASVGSGCAELQGIDLVEILGAGAPLDERTVANGLKQALKVGTERTTTMLSAPGGFGANPALRLAIPGELGRFAELLRGIGLSGQLDALEDAMNRAAEEAAAQAVPVFVGAITSMSISDAFEILNGPDDSATRYFQERTSGELRKRFTPIAGAAMQEVGLYGIYQDLVQQYELIPLTKPPAIDLERYVADQTLAGLFGELAVQEARIREDPAARTTALLRRVFGSSDTNARPGSQ